MFINYQLKGWKDEITCGIINLEKVRIIEMGESYNHSSEKFYEIDVHFSDEETISMFATSDLDEALTVHSTLVSAIANGEQMFLADNKGFIEPIWEAGGQPVADYSSDQKECIENERRTLNEK
jgi:hypothetical protein